MKPQHRPARWWSAAQAEKEKTSMQAAGASFFQRLRIWKEEVGRVRELRRAKAAEIEGLRQKERLHEESLASGVAPEKTDDKK